MTGAKTTPANSYQPAGKFVLIGGALPDAIVANHPRVSAAAARWQLNFVRAVSREFGVELVCLSYLPTSEDPVLAKDAGNFIDVHPIVRKPGWSGAIGYIARMLRAIWQLRDDVSCVFCYNALIWTTPWAYILARLARAPLIVIVADLEPIESPSPRRKVKARIERLLLHFSSKFVVLSPAVRNLLPAHAASMVFSGLADEEALRATPVDYSKGIRFVYVGTISAEAGAGAFVRAAEIVAKNDKAAEFHMFGRGDLSVLSPDALRGRFTCHGFVDEATLDRFLGNGCVGVNPRPTNGIHMYNAPFKVLYYLSRGLVTISTRTEGIPQNIADVCLLTGDSPEELAATMLTTLGMKPEHMAELGERGRSRIKQTQSPKVLFTLLHELLGA